MVISSKPNLVTGWNRPLSVQNCIEFAKGKASEHFVSCASLEKPLITLILCEAAEIRLLPRICQVW